MIEIRARWRHERARFENADNTVVVGSAVYSNKEGGELSIKCPTEGNHPDTNATYHFWGHWGSYRGEDQFIAQSFVACEPYGRTGTLAYLKKLPKIGGVVAERIWKTYGADSIKFLREFPQSVSEEIAKLGLPTAQEASRILRERFATESCTVDLLELFDGRGFPRTLIKDVLLIMGNAAPERIRRDPYQLMRLRGAGFKRCDSLYVDLGLPLNRLKRQALCAWHAIAADSSGDTWHPVSKVEDGLRGAITGTEIRFGDAMRLAHRGKLKKKCPLLDSVWTNGDGQFDWDGDERWVAEHGDAEAEREIAKVVGRLASTPERPQWPGLRVVGLSPHQWDRMSFSITERIGILGGSPGTGKTFVTSCLVRDILNLYGHDSVAVCCPTGKASVRVSEAMNVNGVSIRATTIHSLLKIDRTSGSMMCFEHGPDNPLSFMFIIVDESSMISCSLMRSLLVALSPGAHILFVGDVNQLAPVGHGAPLRDMIQSSKVPYGELTEVRRNSGVIVDTCHRIKDGEDWNVSEFADFNAGDNLTVSTCPYPEAQIGVVCEILKQSIPHGFDPVWDCQVVVAVNRKSKLARVELNKILQAQFNTNARVGNSIFAFDDKVINLQNSWMSCKGPLRDSPDAIRNEKGQVYVANGEIGRVVECERNRMIVELYNPDRTVIVPRGKSTDENQAGCNFDLAYAISVHKSQGSEFPIVLVVLDEYAGAMMVQTREFLYTAISRAKHTCVLIGKLDLAFQMCKNVSLNRRKTFLKELIQDD